MNPIALLIVILIPLIGGMLLFVLPFQKRGQFELYTETVVLIASVLFFLLLTKKPADAFTLISFVNRLSISFQLDGMSMVFGGLISGLWPFATLYAFEYMRHEENHLGERHERHFFAFYTMTFGITLGIALAENLLTMYCFYEMLTLITLPLVMYTMTREAILASRKYLYYSLGGAAFGFIALIFIIVYGSVSFRYGGSLDQELIDTRRNVLLLIYVFAFFGFGVKAAVCPFNAWLPAASVAPTPVTALLHAVAVVKSGAFAVLRLTYYCFGAAFLRGTWAQNVVMTAAIVTILYGSTRAVKETHLKRRLAYSTISNLSYILFGATLMSPAGFVGALSHMVFHGIMKICSFFCAGAVICQSGRTYVHQLDGLGRKMPRVFGMFTLASLALMGVPGLCGFVSKWNLASAALESGNPIAYIGVGVLLLSALLTAVYMLTVVVRAFFPQRDISYAAMEGIHDPGWYMLVPLLVFCIMIVVFGVYSTPFVDFLMSLA
ncbi:MAG: proton-conducting membrane transporter [Clostridium sp.]|nr:proton-conducting membrane transporter [Clostridium sp.]